MGWTTSEAPLPAVDESACGHPGCSGLARVHFLSISSDTNERRIAVRCDEHASELRTKVKRRPVASAPAPHPIDPTAAAMEPKAPEKPKRPPLTWPIPEDAAPTTCGSCGETVFWVVTKNMKRMPIEAFGEYRGESHFAHCVNADAHRKPRETAGRA